MGQGAFWARRPGGILRFLLRAPIWLYRLRLGWLLGERFIMLTHLGRKSGLLRQTVLEVVHYDQAADTYFVVAGWGEKSDWYQNLMKTPRLLIDNGRHRYEAVAEQPTIGTATAVLSDYARRSPVAFKNLGRIMLGTQPPDDDQGFRRLAEKLPMLALKSRA